MANFCKFAKAEAGAITRHFERYKKEDGNYIQFGNQEIEENSKESKFKNAKVHFVLPIPDYIESMYER